MKQRIWFDRSFELGVPVESFPELLERLRGTPARLEERVRDLDPATLTERRAGAWSIQEHVGHLSDLEELWLGRVRDLHDGRPRLREADLTNAATWDAGHNDETMATILSQFRTKRDSLLREVECIDLPDLQRTALHPRLAQPMTVVDLGFFVAEHDDHHLARISWRIAAVGTTSS